MERWYMLLRLSKQTKSSNSESSRQEDFCICVNIWLTHWSHVGWLVWLKNFWREKKKKKIVSDTLFFVWLISSENARKASSSSSSQKIERTRKRENACVKSSSISNEPTKRERERKRDEIECSCMHHDWRRLADRLAGWLADWLFCLFN